MCRNCTCWCALCWYFCRFVLMADGRLTAQQRSLIMCRTSLYASHRKHYPTDIFLRPTRACLHAQLHFCRSIEDMLNITRNFIYVAFLQMVFSSSVKEKKSHDHNVLGFFKWWSTSIMWTWGIVYLVAWHVPFSLQNSLFITVCIKWVNDLFNLLLYYYSNNTIVKNAGLH